jgi:hypothetical protein
MRHSATDFCPVCDRTGFSRIGGLIQAGKPAKIVTIGPWTHVISLPPFTTLFGRVDHHLFTYRASTGELGLLPSFRLGSTSTDPALNQFADAFFSTLCCFEVNGTSYLLFTDSATLHRAIHRISFDPKGNPSATFFNKAFEENISIERGYTHAVPCTLAGVTHVVSYDRFTGDVLLERMDQVNGLDISPQVVASTRLGTAAPFKTGWTGLAVTEVGDEPLVVGTAADSGIAWVAALQLPAGGPPPLIAVDRFLSPRNFLKGVHTHLTAIAPHGQPTLFAYSPIDGYGYFYRPRPRGTGIDFLRSMALGLGGQMIFGSGAPALGSLVTDQRPPASPLDETTFYWFYNAATGKIRLGELA